VKKQQIILDKEFISEIKTDIGGDSQMFYYGSSYQKNYMSSVDSG